MQFLASKKSSSRRSKRTEMFWNCKSRGQGAGIPSRSRCFASDSSKYVKSSTLASSVSVQLSQTTSTTEIKLIRINIQIESNSLNPYLHNDHPSELTSFHCICRIFVPSRLPCNDIVQFHDRIRSTQLRLDRNHIQYNCHRHCPAHRNIQHRISHINRRHTRACRCN